MSDEDVAMMRAIELLKLVGQRKLNDEERRELDGLLAIPITVPGVGTVTMGQMTAEHWERCGVPLVARLDQNQSELRDLEAAERFLVATGAENFNTWRDERRGDLPRMVSDAKRCGVALEDFEIVLAYTGTGGEDEARALWNT